MQVSILPVPAHSNKYKYGGQHKLPFCTAGIINSPSNDLCEYKNGHKKLAEKFRDLCSAGTLYMQF
jgi:hypothetical protein